MSQPTNTRGARRGPRPANARRVAFDVLRAVQVDDAYANLLLPTRIAIAVTLYYAVMRIARVKILDECVEFAMSKLMKKNK